MIHPDYKYVNVATGGVFNRKGLYDITKLGNPSGKSETYCTYFRYNQEMAWHFAETGSVAGFTGSAWADWLPIDIDSSDLEEAQFSLQQLVNNLQDYEVDTNACRFYFSGSKGFHCMIPSAYFGAVPSDDIHKRFRKVAMMIAGNLKIDSAIYDKTRIFRLPNTINEKSGLHKIELYEFEAMSLPIADILQKAQKPIQRLQVETSINPSRELSEAYNEPLTRERVSSGERSEVKVKICMSKLMTGVGHGERDNVGVRVASHLRQSGLTPKMMYSALDEWNNTNNPPLNDEELSRIFRQGLQDYGFGCNDYILKANCDPNCLFYKDRR